MRSLSSSGFVSVSSASLQPGSGIAGPSPIAWRGLFPSALKLTCGRRSASAAPSSRILRAGLKRTRPFLTAAVQAIPYAGSSTWIRQG